MTGGCQMVADQSVGLCYLTKMLVLNDKSILKYIIHPKFTRNFTET